MRHIRYLTLLLHIALATGALLGAGVVHAHNESAEGRTGLSAASRLAKASSKVGQSQSRSGWFHVIYGDAPSASGVSGITGYVLIDDQGQTTELLIDEQMQRTLGGARSINHRRITVTGQAAMAPFTEVQSALRPLLAVLTLQLDGPQLEAAAVATNLAVTGPQPWATILCRFADVAVTPHPVAWFNTLMFGTSPPGLDHYWREVSFNNVNLVGSSVHGWYTLPHPRSYYVYGAQFDMQRATSDCTGVANTDVYFPSYVGINLMFNDDLDGAAWGGSWTLSLDGVVKTYRMTWVPPWGYENQGPIAHEMGHGFGLPHSSGPYSSTYDSRWDVMSDVWDNCPPYDSVYGCVGPHTISYHKDLLGWIPAARKYVAAPGTSKTIALDRLGQPTSGTGYLMAKLPIDGVATQFYTVEVRGVVGYDAKLPGNAVVIHRVDTTRSDRDAQVVDTDGNGNPNDNGAMWLPGETFVDSANGFSVTVNAQTTTGFQVTIRSEGSANPPRDLDGDGKADVLWRHAGGLLSIWRMNGTSIGSGGSPGSVDAGWTVQGIGDFDGDGKADILWRHVGGLLSIWFMNGTTISSSSSPGSVDVGWTVQGIGDFNGDGKADVLWRHSSGLVYIWLMDGTNIIGAGSPGSAGFDWTIEGVGDFDGNGKADILWRHAGGLLSIWLMNATTISSTGSPGTVDAGWTVQGIADFDGDGKADILWRHAGGLLSIWLMNATTISSSGSPGSVGPDWTFDDVGDFNDDAKADILWRHSGGLVIVWLMSSTTIMGSGSPASVGPGWSIQ